MENEISKLIKEGLTELTQHDSDFPVSFINKRVPHIKLMPNITTAKEFIKQTFIESDYTVKEFEWLQNYDKVAQWLCDNESMGIILLGYTGTGKSRFLNSTIPIAFSLLERPLIIQPVCAYDLSTQNFRKLLEKTFIAIDEIGREPVGNDYGSKFEMLEIIADHCEKYGKLFFATTNFTYDQLLARYGEPCLKRLIKLCKWIEFTSKSKR